jgi:hypothetical protein
VYYRFCICVSIVVINLTNLELVKIMLRSISCSKLKLHLERVIVPYSHVSHDVVQII